MSIDVKSIVFYPEAAARAAGFTSPRQALQDLVAFTDRAAASGTTPWCFGIESDPSPGGPATDRVGNLMLLRHGSADGVRRRRIRPDARPRWAPAPFPAS